MPNVAAKLNLSQVGRVCVTVADTDRAIDFYVGTLGFEKVVDVPMGPDMRWVEVQVAGTPTTIALAPPPLGLPGAADVLAARPGRELADHRSAFRLVAPFKCGRRGSPVARSRRSGRCRTAQLVRGSPASRIRRAAKGGFR